ncbi:hypothetical protein [Lysinibacter cavernae]|uniref:Uncharacterized protein n=1 Tax=Lysinibacter cavernae TaxID=1640652 RepID=A0A7X5TVF6_9MICO|nr:hypothetical protein [Lysinibacter cavernae]NIH55012.1 hypothetical protein [Lysinibacter cavernae]
MDDAALGQEQNGNTVSQPLALALTATIDAAVTQLEDAQVPDEALATLIPSQRVRLIRRKARFEPAGRVWRLGVFLLGHDGRLYGVGETTRAVEPGHPGYQSASQEQRREYRAMAFAGPFARGDVLNFNTVALPIESGTTFAAEAPLLVHEGTARVRWRPGAGQAEAVPFDSYLAEKIDLAIGLLPPSA